MEEVLLSLCGDLASAPTQGKEARTDYVLRYIPWCVLWTPVCWHILRRTSRANIGTASHSPQQGLCLDLREVLATILRAEV